MIFPLDSYTVESVTAGHPDKICDQISDAILDACLAQDPTSRVAMEAFGTHGFLIVGGEITTEARIDASAIARTVYQEIGYPDELEIIERIVKQSPDIAMGVDTGGAGDQGMMYGFASNETPQMLPRALVLVHQLTKGLQDLRTSGTVTWLKPDGKAQVTVHNGAVKTILVSTQHAVDMGQDQIRDVLTKQLIAPLVKSLEGIEILINPTGQFIKGGFEADTGLTGRKIMVDTYGGLIPHGGGCFSGKDATKVDRSAAYMARFAAKQLVAEGHGAWCLVSVAYAIGRSEPVMLEAVNDRGERLSEIVQKRFDFRPQAIIERLNLRAPIFRQTATYGHFGKAHLPWEEIE